MISFIRRLIHLLHPANNCSGCGHWESFDRRNGRCDLWRSVMFSGDPELMFPADAPLPGTKMPAAGVCSGFKSQDQITVTQPAREERAARRLETSE